MNAVKLGFVGCGMHGSFLQSLVRRVPELELVAVCDIDGAKARRNARHFGAAEWYDDHSEMLAKCRAELVAVVGTPQMHVDIGIDVLDSGRHLFVEKPLGVDLPACQKLADAVRRNGKIAMNGYMWRYATPIARMKQITETARFGTPLSMHVRFLTPQPRFAIWGLDDPLATCVITDGGHPLDIMMHIMGAVERVTAFLAEGNGGVSSIACVLEFTGGRLGTLHTGTCTSGVDLDFHVCSSMGYGIKLQDNMNRMFYVAADDVDYQRVPIVEGWYPAPLTVSDADHTGWSAELAELAACVRKGRQPGNDMQSGLQVMQVMAAIKQSIGARRPVTVSELTHEAAARAV